MKLHRIPALMGAGCLALLMGAYTAGAQQQPSGTTGSTGSTGASASPNSTTSGQGQMDAQAAGMNGSSGKASAMDKKFVKEAMEGSNAEVQLGQMAQEKASSDDVKQFGQRMVTDHGKMKEQMAPIASQMGITASDDLSAKDKALQKKLEGLNGADFDKAYMSAMVQDHKKDLAEFKHEASSAKDPQVKEQAQQGSQIISEHLQMAQDVAQKVGASTSGKMANGHTAPLPKKAVGGASGSAIGGGGDTAGHHNSVGSGEGSTTSNPK